VKYQVQFGDRTVVVDVTGDRVAVDGVELVAHLTPIHGTPLYHLLLGSESWMVAADAGAGADAGRWVLSAAGERREVTAVDDRTRQIRELMGRRAVPAHGGVVRAPMPGLVVRIEVAVGDAVEPGKSLVVVEAMKMENELRAPAAGLVTAVHVAAGAPVEKGAALVTLQLTAP
jgi:pyruvate carboxylase subunit B